MDKPKRVGGGFALPKKPKKRPPPPAVERAPTPRPPSPPPPPEPIMIPPEIQSAHDMSFAPSEPVYVDHSMHREILRRHNERRQDVMHDMSFIPSYGYSNEAPWYNPFGRREVKWMGEDVYEREMDRELRVGSQQYANEILSDAGRPGRSSRHSPPHTTLRPFTRDE